MEANENKVTRKGSKPIKVYCLPDERAAIEANAQAAGMSTSAYLLAVGQGYQVKGVTDFENVRDLVRVNGDRIIEREELMDAVLRHKVGDTIKVQYRRDEKYVDVDVTLAPLVLPPPEAPAQP